MIENPNKKTLVFFRIFSEIVREIHLNKLKHLNSSHQIRRKTPSMANLNLLTISSNLKTLTIL